MKLRREVWTADKFSIHQHMSSGLSVTSYPSSVHRMELLMKERIIYLCTNTPTHIHTDKIVIMVVQFQKCGDPRDLLLLEDDLCEYL